MSYRMKATLQTAAALLVILLAITASLNVLDILPSEELWSALTKAIQVWGICTVAAIVIAIIVKPKPEDQ